MKLFALFAVLLLLPFVHAVETPVEASDVAGEVGLPSGEEFSQQAGQAIGTSLGQSVAPTINSTLQQVVDVVNRVVQMIILGFMALAAVVFLWLIIVLIVLRHIMKREDLTGCEKAAWAFIVLFGGFIPFSIFGILLYALSSGKKKPVEPQKKV